MLKINIFPYAFMANSLAMTALMILCGLAGLSEITADIAIIHAITVAVFNSFSANSRNLILRNSDKLNVSKLLFYRFSLLLPLSALTLTLATLSKVNLYIAGIFLARKIIEWLDELFLSEMERNNSKRVAFNYFITQVGLLLFAALWVIGDMPYPLLGFLLWATLPLVLSFRFYKSSLNSNYKSLVPIIYLISPHIGSTAVIGISVYVFRLVLVDFFGKLAASDLFVAFSIGGILGSLIANAFGPSLVFNQKDSESTYPTILKWLMFVFLILGLALACSSSALAMVYKTPLFWKSVGLSMIGAVPMVLAQITRHQLLQTHHENDLFGPDVLMNVILIASIPLIYFLLGSEYLTAMYLLSSAMAWIFYKSYESYEFNRFAYLRALFFKTKPFLICLLILPIFFQLDLTLFRSQDPSFESHGIISKLPIPFSVIANFIILIGIGAYSQTRTALTFIFFSFVLMSLSLIISSPSGSLAQQSKFIQLAQFTLPMFALITGQAFETTKDASKYGFEQIFFYSIFAVVCVQMFVSLINGSEQLQPTVYIFSIYQYLHYVPVMLIISYMFIFERLWAIKQKYLLLTLWLLLSVYTNLSGSLFLIVNCLIAMLTYIFLYASTSSKSTHLKIILAILVIGLICLVTNNIHVNTSAGSIFGKAQSDWQEKTDHWNAYVNYFRANPMTLLFGDKDASYREQIGSAHNYYLDFIYTFGLVALLPLLGLIISTISRSYNCLKSIKMRTDLLFPLISLSFILLIENNYTMGLKQPYPGILSFFLWGIYLSRLNLKKE